MYSRAFEAENQEYFLQVQSDTEMKLAYVFLVASLALVLPPVCGRGMKQLFVRAPKFNSSVGDNSTSPHIGPDTPTVLAKVEDKLFEEFRPVQPPEDATQPCFKQRAAGICVASS